jgi:hypothetical protein
MALVTYRIGQEARFSSSPHRLWDSYAVAASMASVKAPGETASGRQRKRYTQKDLTRKEPWANLWPGKALSASKGERRGTRRRTSAGWSPAIVVADTSG